jgi:hypothetical protein
MLVAKMEILKKYWVWGVASLLLTILIVFLSFFKQEIGILYIPESGEIYHVKFGRLIDPYNKLKMLNPFSSVVFNIGNPFEEEYLGILNFNSGHIGQGDIENYY